MRISQKIVHIKTSNTILYCNRWLEAVSFYKTKLGLPVISSNAWFVEFKLNQTARLSIADASRTTIVSSEGKGVTITFEVDNIENTYAQLVKADLQPTPIKNHHWGAKVIYLFDPEGHRLEFWA